MHSVKLKNINQSLSSSLVDARLAFILNKYGREALLTTSFGTTSVLMLHILARVKPGFPIHFVDTGFLFPETHEYKEELVRRLDLNIITHKPRVEAHEAAKISRLWETDPDACCGVNKIAPIEQVKNNHQVWISGLIGYQNGYRSGLDIFQERSDIYRFYPLIDWSESQVVDYFEYFGLPRHPLERMGFKSVGCMHCTIKGSGREGRWNGTDKSECGLHI